MIPKNARVFPLAEGAKVPPKGSHGHLDAKPAESVPAGNYGIALDGQFIVVDFDTSSVGHEWVSKMPITWTQKTRRGEHYLFRLPPAVGLEKARNARFDRGDVKVRGYIVGPGSVVAGHIYYLAVNYEPEVCPDWLWDFVTQKRDLAPGVAGGEEEIDVITQDQGRDDTLAKVAGLLRRIGLSEKANTRALWGINQTIVEPPLSENDIRRIAKSASKYEIVKEETGALIPAGWINAADVEYAGPVIRWHVWGFVPHGELVMLYGKGGTGKSSFGSWIAAQVTQKGGRVAVLTVEESPKLFAWRAQLSGGRLDHIMLIPSASTVQFPRDAGKLKEAIIESKADLLYIDSIYSHLETGEGLNAAERARKGLAPLAEIAKETGCTILGVFHENKAGDFLGSVEMVNVPRYILKATREPGRALYVEVTKTNIVQPGFLMKFEGTEVAASDPTTGEIQMAENKEGVVEPMSFTIISRSEDVSLNTVNVDDLEDPKDAPISPLGEGQATIVRTGSSCLTIEKDYSQAATDGNPIERIKTSKNRNKG